MTIPVRLAEPRDFKDIQRLNAELFKYEDALDLYGHSRNLDWPYSEVAIKYFRDAVSGKNNTQGFVAVVDNRIVGYLIASVYSKLWMSTNPIAEIDNMFIESSSRRHHAGAGLIAVFKKWASAQGVKRLKVGALTGNDPAMAFYRSQGFTDIETVFEQSVDIKNGS